MTQTQEGEVGPSHQDRIRLRLSPVAQAQQLQGHSIAASLARKKQGERACPLPKLLRNPAHPTGRVAELKGLCHRQLLFRMAPEGKQLPHMRNTESISLSNHPLGKPWSWERQEFRYLTLVHSSAFILTSNVFEVTCKLHTHRSLKFPHSFKPTSTNHQSADFITPSLSSA